MNNPVDFLLIKYTPTHPLNTCKKKVNFNVWGSLSLVEL